MSNADHSIGIENSTVGVASTGKNANIFERCAIYSLGENGALSERPPIDLSYYRINRQDQLSALESRTSERRSRPMVCIFRGDVSQCLDKFLECLCGFDWQIRVFGRGNPPFRAFIDWPWGAADAGIIRHKVLAWLANKLDFPPERGTPEAINAATKHQPVVIHTMITPKKFAKLPDGRAALEQFMEFWESWPGRDHSNAPFLVCIMVLRGRFQKVETARMTLRWLFARIIGGGHHEAPDIDECVQTLSDDPLVAPEFKSVAFDDVYVWSQEHDILERIRLSGLDSGAAIQQIFDASDSQFITMQDLAEALAAKFPLPLPAHPHPKPNNQ